MNDYYLYCCRRTEAAETAARMRAALASGEHPRRLAQDSEGAEGWWRTVFAADPVEAQSRAIELLGDGADVEVIGPDVLLGIF